MAQSLSTSARQGAASAACNSLHRAYRDLRLYPIAHPAARESIERLAAAVAEYVDNWGTLTLAVQENALLLEGEPVYVYETSRDNLAFLMFRDGMRSLSLHPDGEVEELEALVDCLAHTDDLADMEHDLVTALWELDLTHIDYRVVDPFLGGGVLQEGMVDALRETVLRRLEAVQAPGLSSGDLARVEIRQVEPRLIESGSLQLTPQEIERSKRAIEGLSSVFQDFAEVLLELAVNVPITGANDVLIRSLTAVLAQFLDRGNLEEASSVLGRLKQLEAQLWVPAGSFGWVSGSAITADHIRGLLQPVGQVSADRIKETQSFLKSVRRWIAPSLLEILVETGDRVVRKTVLELLGGEGSVSWRDLEPLLADSRWYVVRNAVQLAAVGGHEELAEHARRLLGHQDARVRRAIVRALERFDGPDVLSGLMRALSDPDLSVRTLAASALGRKGGREQEGLLLARIEDRGFPLLAGEEVEAFFGAYAELAGERAIPLLDRSWRKRGLSSRPAAFRVAAIRALGRVRGPAARTALQEAAESRDPQIRRAAAETAQGKSSTASGEPS